MDAKTAVAAAKSYFLEVFGETPTLEEIWFDQRRDEWCVTLGRQKVIRFEVPSAFGPNDGQQTSIDYKVVRIRDDDGRPVSIKNRSNEKAA